MAFQKGNKAAVGHGRKGYGMEEQFREIFHGIFDPNNTKLICLQLRGICLGQKIDMATGKMVDDPDSTPESKRRAIQLAMAYKGGLPVQHVAVNDAPTERWDELINAFNKMDEMDDGTLDKIIKAAGMEDIVTQAENIKNGAS